MKEPTQPPVDPEKAVREAAIDRFIRGEKPTAICRAVQRSRAWFYRILERYRRGGRAALRSRSRAPHRVHNRTVAETAAAIVRLRQTIAAGQDAELRYAERGADALAAELARAGVLPPSRATINRVLRDHGLTQPRRPQRKRGKLPDDFPWPTPTAPNHQHLFDFVVRSIRGEGRCYGYNLLDYVRRWPFLQAAATKTTEQVSLFLVAVWQELGLPTSLYIDNDPVWTGGGRGQRVLSTIVRLCLLVGIEVIFTPPDTPQANATMESFNDLWQSNFWSRTTFRDLAHVQAELPLFERYCRQRRPLPDADGRTAEQIAPDFVPTRLARDFDRHRQNDKLPITAGYVHFIRFVSGSGTFSILNEKWQLDKGRWASKTVRATIDTQQQQLFVYHQPKGDATCQLIAQFDYPLGEDILPLAEVYQRLRPVLWPPVAKGDC